MVSRKGSLLSWVTSTIPWIDLIDHTAINRTVIALVCDQDPRLDVRLVLIVVLLHGAAIIAT